MDFILEFIFEVILEGIFGLVIENPRVKTWTKTIFVLVFSQVIAGFVFWLAFRQADNAIGFVGLALEVIFLYSIISGHRQNWEQF